MNLAGEFPQFPSSFQNGNLKLVAADGSFQVSTVSISLGHALETKQLSSLQIQKASAQVEQFFVESVHSECSTLGLQVAHPPDKASGARFESLLGLTGSRY